MFFGLAEDHQGNLCIGGGDGMWSYDGEKVIYYTGKHLNKIKIELLLLIALIFCLIGTLLRRLLGTTKELKWRQDGK